MLAGARSDTTYAARAIGASPDLAPRWRDLRAPQSLTVLAFSAAARVLPPGHSAVRTNLQQILVCGTRPARCAVHVPIGDQVRLGWERCRAVYGAQGKLRWVAVGIFGRDDAFWRNAVLHPLLDRIQGVEFIRSEPPLAQ